MKSEYLVSIKNKAQWWFSVGMPRSGSTLQFLLIRNLLQRRDALIDYSYLPYQQFNEVYDKHANSTDNILVRTHPFLPEHSRAALHLVLKPRGKVRLVYIHRDIRDVMASLCINRPVLKTDLDLFETELKNLLRVHELWTNCDAEITFVAQYEELFQYPYFEISRLAKFLEVDLSGEEIESLMQKYSYQAVTKRYATDKQFANVFTSQNPFHGGTIGRWEAELSKKQKEVIDDFALEYLIYHRYVAKRYL